MQTKSFGKKYGSISLVTLSMAVSAFIVVSACTDNQAKAKLNMVHKEAPRPGVVAKINGQEVTEDELIGDDKLDFFDLKKREYELKMDRLNRLVLDKFVGPEAKAANMSVDDYVSKKIVGGDLKISDKEYKKFVAEKHVPESQLNPQLKERIMAYLQSLKKQELVQAYIAKVTAKNPVEVYFNKPKMEMQVETGNGPMYGGEHAPVTIVEFSDFQCPFCGRAAETVTELKKKYGNKIRLFFRQFPLPMHNNARAAAEASLCLNDQGVAKFWKFHDQAFKNQDKLDTAGLEKIAKDTGADMGKFKECVTSKKFGPAIQTDIDYGEKLGVKSTPTFFINGELVSGALPIEQFSEIIDDDLNPEKK